LAPPLPARDAGLVAGGTSAAIRNAPVLTRSESTPSRACGCSNGLQCHATRMRGDQERPPTTAPSGAHGMLLPVQFEVKAFDGRHVHAAGSRSEVVLEGEIIMDATRYFPFAGRLLIALNVRHERLSKAQTTAGRLPQFLRQRFLYRRRWHTQEAVAVEIVCSVMLIVGFRTRAAAAVLRCTAWQPRCSSTPISPIRTHHPLLEERGDDRRIAPDRRLWCGFLEHRQPRSGRRTRRRQGSTLIGGGLAMTRRNQSHQSRRSGSNPPVIATFFKEVDDVVRSAKLAWKNTRLPRSTAQGQRRPRASESHISITLQTISTATAPAYASGAGRGTFVAEMRPSVPL